MDLFDETGMGESFMDLRERRRFSLSDTSIDEDVRMEDVGEDMQADSQEARRNVEFSLEKQRVINSQRQELEKLKRKQEETRRDFEESPEQETNRLLEQQRELAEIRQSLSEFLHELVPHSEEYVFRSNQFEAIEFPRDLVDIEEAIAQVVPDGLPGLGDMAATVLLTYAEGVRTLLQPHLRRKTIGDNMRDFLKFLTLAVCFGPDRALIAALRKDSMWVRLRYKEEDRKFERFVSIGIDTTSSMDTSVIEENDNTLRVLRMIYYALMRRDGFDPRTSIHHDLGQFDFVFKSQKSKEQPRSHSEPRPSRVRFPSPGRIPRLGITEEQAASNEARMTRLLQFHERRVYEERMMQQRRSTSTPLPAPQPSSPKEDVRVISGTTPRKSLGGGARKR